ncbi:hypothetical protein POTOM_026768 [Populus tomentosa]|uniref:3-epi-6-deoxocathasterone 23-monooxygenase n=1 Tax=Populus tomentosa TaxID=118781 RepID=A0A8X7ZDI8_POPTO|nr:hypothetical protein POTOM_026768 [Populus tomentosa]
METTKQGMGQNLCVCVYVCRYGKVFKTHILGTPIIVSTDPAVNKVVLQNHGNIFIPAYPKSIREIFGEYSILQTNGTLQKKVHALIGGFLRSPQFKTRITKDIEHHVKLTLTSWKDRPLLLIQEETQKFTFKVLVKALLSLDPSDDLDFLKREFDEFIKGLICLPIKLPGTRLYKSLKAKERIFKLVKRIVEQRKLGLEKSEDQEHQNTIPNDAVDVLLRDISGEQNDKQSLSLDFIISHIIELMIPGEETVPMSMTLAVKFLSDCPVALELLTVYISICIFMCIQSSTLYIDHHKIEIWFLISLAWLGLRLVPRKTTSEERGTATVASSWSLLPLLIRIECSEENMKLKRQKTDSGDDYCWTDYMSLQFTQNVINETLRVANIINAVWRKALKDVEIKGILIPEGWCVLTSFSSVHMDEENYENPYEFDPWRWEKTGASVKNNCFTPFGGGQRLCPGLELSRLEISIFLHHLVTTYRWIAEKDDIIYFPTVKLKKKLPIRVTSIGNSP